MSSGAPHSPDVQAVFESWMERDPDSAIAVAAIQALIQVVGQSKATTIMGLEVELKAAADLLKQKNRYSISLTAACELFNRYVTRTLEDIRDFDQCKNHLLSRGNNFASMSMHSRQKISEYGGQFIHDNCTVLVHGRSRVVTGLLKYAANKGKQFSVLVTEGRPKNESHVIVDELLGAGIPVTVILDSAVAHKMEDVDFVLVGAEGVVENGGIINIIGTYQVAIVAQSMNKPVYVAAESFKFARMFPLTQKDIPSAIQRQHSEMEDKRSSSSPENLGSSPVLKKAARIETPACDYTPPKYITLLFTDLGILTPSAVSDELIKLYY